jgi:hypothetical protein
MPKSRYWLDTEFREKIKKRSLKRYHALSKAGRKRYNSKTALRSRFGKNKLMTLEAFDAMLVKQGGRCATCRGKHPGRKKWNGRSWCIDHDHKTGRVRGLVCLGCNMALGAVKDNVKTLRAMIVYLQK